MTSDGRYRYQDLADYNGDPNKEKYSEEWKAHMAVEQATFDLEKLAEADELLYDDNGNLVATVIYGHGVNRAKRRARAVEALRRKKYKCSSCGQAVRIQDGVVATHNYPVPTGQVCKGSGKPPEEGSRKW